MKIIRNVIVKQVVTEKSKAKIRRNFKEHKLRLEQECQQLLFEKRKLQHKNKPSAHELEERFQSEINNRQEKMKLVEFKMEQLELLEYGSEIVETEVEALVEVEVGSSWEEIEQGKTIIIQDGEVIRIE